MEQQKRFPKQYQQNGKSGKIMFVFENEEGEIFCEEPTEETAEEEEVAIEEVTEETEGINLVEDDTNFAQSDFCPGAFLGQAQ